MRGPKTAIIFSAAGMLFAAAMAVVTTPLFVRALGIEGYGLIGTFTTMQVLLSIVELGAGATFTREIARFADDRDEMARIWRLGRALERLACCISAGIGLIVVLAAPLIVRHWVKLTTLSPHEAVTALRFSGISIACQLPSMMYGAGLLGRNRQTLIALVSLPFTAARTLGILLVLWLVTPGVELFFALTAAVSVTQFLVMRHLFWREFRDVAAGQSSAGEFAAFLLSVMATSAVSITGTILIQSDKIIASGLLPLADFGYYMLATALANAIVLLSGPICGTTFPRLSMLATQPASQELSEVYHAATQLLAVSALPLAAVLALFPDQVLQAWTANPHVVANSRNILAVLAVANGIGGSLSLLFYLELSQGRTAPAIYSHLASIAVLLPMLPFLIGHFGAVGAAAAWLLHNIGMLLFRPPITHNRLPREDLRAWYLEDIGPALAIVAGLGCTIKAVLPMPDGRLWLVLALGLVWMVLALAACAASWRIRSGARVAYRRLSLVVFGNRKSANAS